MKILSVQQMREADSNAIEKFKIPSLVLMENAGRSVAREIMKNTSLDKKKVIIVAGKGNNGGDGLVIARILSTLDINISVFLLSQKEELSVDAMHQLSICEKSNIEINYFNEKTILNHFKLSVLNSSLVVDAIFGTGLKGKLKYLQDEIIKIINNSAVSVISVDIPSGISGDSGSIVGNAVKADVTVTFGALKRGHFLLPGRSYCGNIIVSDIGIPTAVIDNLSSVELITPALVKKKLPVRDNVGHKGSFGKVLIVAGSEEMRGAPRLSGLAAFKTGSGLVTLALCEDLMHSAENFIEATTLKLNRGSCLDTSGADIVIDNQQRYDSVVLGPGLGREDRTKEAIRKIVEKTEIPIVLDADGLIAFSENFKLLENKNLIITPHHGEMQMLTGISIEEIRRDPLNVARNIAVELKITVHLKGPLGQVVDGKNDKSYILPVMNNALAKGGSGDVLSGVIASLIGQGLDMHDAAITGVLVHSLSGVKAAEYIGSRSTTAVDIIDCIPLSFKSIENEEKFDFIPERVF